MSTGYGWEGLRQACAMLLGAHHVPERLCGRRVYLGRFNKCSTFTFYTYTLDISYNHFKTLLMTYMLDYDTALCVIYISVPYKYSYLLSDLLTNTHDDVVYA